MCLAPDEFPRSSKLLCGGIWNGFAWSWGSSPRSLVQTIGLPERPSCRVFQRSGGLPSPTPKYWITAPISNATSEDWQPPPFSHFQMWWGPAQGMQMVSPSPKAFCRTVDICMYIVIQVFFPFILISSCIFLLIVLHIKTLFQYIYYGSNTC